MTHSRNATKACISERMRHVARVCSQLMGPLALQAGHGATGRVEEALLARRLEVGAEGGRGRALLLGQAHGCRASLFHS